MTVRIHTDLFELLVRRARERKCDQPLEEESVLANLASSPGRDDGRRREAGSTLSRPLRGHAAPADSYTASDPIWAEVLSQWTTELAQTRVGAAVDDLPEGPGVGNPVLWSNRNVPEILVISVERAVRRLESYRDKLVDRDALPGGLHFALLEARKTRELVLVSAQVALRAQGTPAWLPGMDTFH